MVNNFTTITLPKDLLERLKEEKKSCRQRTYRSLFEYFLVMQKNYLRLKKTKDLMNVQHENVEETEDFSQKIETLTEKTSNSFNFILEKFNDQEARLNILEEKMGLKS